MQLSGILPSRVVISYVFDYLIIIFLIIAFSALDKAEPFHQRFSVHNTSLQYPFADPERIAPWLAAMVSCAFPLVVIIIWAMVIDGLFSHQKNVPARRNYPRRGVYTLKERLWEMNAGFLGLGLSVAAAITITGALKNLTGKPRPDLLARCKVKPDWVEPPVGLTGYEQCTGDPHILRDGFKSWPSGHSSVAFAGLGYLSIYLAGKLHVLDNRGEVWKTVLVLIPLLAASMVAVSRIMDGRHHPFDVLSSSLLGLFTAWVAYRQYFPPLAETGKGRAYPIRSWGTQRKHSIVEEANSGYLPPSDEEEGKGGYTSKVGRALASGLTEDESIVDASKQRRRPNQSQSMLPSGSAGLSSQPTSYQQTASHDPEFEDVDSYEMRDRKGKPGDTAYQPYSGSSMSKLSNRQNTQSTQDSDESEDRRWGIAAATNAIGGQTLAFTPIQEEFNLNTKTGYPRKGTGESSDDGFVQVDTISKGVELRDEGSLSRRV